MCTERAAERPLRGFLMVCHFDIKDRLVPFLCKRCGRVSLVKSAGQGRTGNKIL